MIPTVQEAFEFIVKLVSRPTTALNGFGEAQSLSQALEILKARIADKPADNPPDDAPKAP